MRVASAKIKRSDPYYDVKKRRDITPSAKNVYYALLSLQRTCGDVYPSHDWIADECGISRSTSIRAVAELHRLGFIIKTQRGSMKSNVYSVVLPADLPAEQQKVKSEMEQGPVDEHANDSPVQNDGHQSSYDQDQVANDCHVIGNPVVIASVVDTIFTSVFAVVPVIEDAFAVAETFAVGIPDGEPVTALEWLDAAFLPDGELKQVAVQYCIEQGVTDPEEQKYFVRSLDDPDYPPYVKPIHNPTPAVASEWEDLPF
ncbi:helix-turn-helix domain-containing protein [Serratia marcescens]|nr:helix-turn-helix domain-containing protein [Serratia marcescens]MBH2817555.1 helix-turn-helix domain-containing protein [Serratia marcescens]